MSRYLKISFWIVLFLLQTCSYTMEVKPKGFSNKLIERMQAGDPDLLRAFLVYKKACGSLDINAQNKLGWQAIHYAVQDGNLEMVRLLIEFGASVNAKAQDERGRRPLHLAASTGNEELLKSLVQAGADLDLTDDLDLLPHHHVINRKMRDLIVQLTTSPASTRSFVDENKSITKKGEAMQDQSLQEAINSLPQYSFGNSAATEVLPIDECEALPPKNSNNNAKLRDSGKSVKQLRRKKKTAEKEKSNKKIVPVKEKKAIARDAFASAIMDRRIEELRYLIASAANVNCLTTYSVAGQQNSASPLHFAVPSGHHTFCYAKEEFPVLLQMTYLLIRNGADVNDQRNFMQDTALHKLIRYISYKPKRNELIASEEYLNDHKLLSHNYKKRVKLARYLIEEGANLTARNKENLTPAELYRENWCTSYESKPDEALLSLLLPPSSSSKKASN